MLIDHKYGAHGGTLSAMDIAAIIDTLVDNRIRATYEAVADLVGIDIISLRRELGPCGPDMSWIVASDTGRPACCPDTSLADGLFDNPVIIRDAARLRFLVKASDMTRDSN